MQSQDVSSPEAVSETPADVLQRTLRNYTRMLRAYPAAAVFALASFGVVMYFGYTEGKMLHAVGYLLAVCLGVFVTDLGVAYKPKPTVGFPIKKPVGIELAVIAVCTMLGIAFLLVRFFGDWENIKGLARLALMPLLLFTFPIALALIYLFWFRYKPRELGVNINYWWLAIPLHVIVGGVTMLVAYEGSQWREGWKEFGWQGMLVTGVLGAALSEEFVRMLLQTRLAKWLNNVGMGFVLATLVWAMMHVPVVARNNPDKEIWLLALASVSIVPLGFLWGYLTHRTKSLLPAVLLHGFNLWGLQNL